MATRKMSLIVKLPLPKKPANSRPSTASGSTHPSSQSSEFQCNQTILHHFTQSHLVLALMIQKSKPEGLSIKEYCEQLKNNIKSGSRISHEQLRYVDTTGFWKDQYTKIHLEKSVVEEKLRCAEETNRLLHQAVRRSEVNSDLKDTDFSPWTESSGPSNLRKRPSPTQEEDFLEEEAALTICPALPNEDLLRLSSYILQLKRQRAQLDKAFKTSNTIDQIENLATQTIRTLALLQTPFFDCCLPSLLLKTDSHHDRISNLLKRVTSHIGVSFLACFKAFDELCKTIPGRSKKSEIVFHLVMVFQTFLDFLKTISGLQADQQDTLHHGRSVKRARAEEGEYVLNKYLAEMLSSVAYNLDWKLHQPGHSDLLEGILFSIIEHTGRLLSEAVFGEHVSASDSPGNISKNLPQSSKAAARIEARYVVQILHATLGGETRKDLVTQILSSGRVSTGTSRLTSSNLLGGDLLMKTRKLLQSTLMKTAIGGDDLETIRLPTPPLEGAGMAVLKEPVVERYGPDWLVETVWTLIGWDLMN